MRQLYFNELYDISGGRFRLQFNPFQFIGAIAVGAIMGGPVGVGMAVGAAIIAQGTGNLHDMYINPQPGGTK